MEKFPDVGWNSIHMTNEARARPQHQRTTRWGHKLDAEALSDGKLPLQLSHRKD
jgi:hypothetical protein